MAKLPPLGPLGEGITITYFHKNKPDSLHMSQPSQFAGNVWNEGGDGYYHPKAEEEHMDQGLPSWCKLCG